MRLHKSGTSAFFPSLSPCSLHPFLHPLPGSSSVSTLLQWPEEQNATGWALSLSELLKPSASPQRGVFSTLTVFLCRAVSQVWLRFQRPLLMSVGSCTCAHTHTQVHRLTYSTYELSKNLLYKCLGFPRQRLGGI